VTALSVLPNLPDVDAALANLGPLHDRVEVVVQQQLPLWAGSSSWVVLPAATGDGVRWEVHASDSEAQRRAEEVIPAFVGPSTGRLQRIAPVSSSEASVVLTLCGVHDQQSLVEAVELMVSVRSAEPRIGGSGIEPLAFLIRDFHLALGLGDADESAAILERIDLAGALSLDNLRFLRVERLARLSRWAELVGLPWFADLARARRPRHISEYLLEGLWWAHFGETLLQFGAGEGLNRFDSLGLGDTYRSLLEAVDTPIRPLSLRLTWLWSVSCGDVARQERLKVASVGAESAVLDLLAGRSAGDSSTWIESRSEGVRRLFDEGEFASAVALAEENPDDADIVAQAVRAAFELDDPELARRACRLVTPEIEQRLPSTRGFRASLQSVRSQAGNECLGWDRWLERVANGEPWPHAAATARNLVGSWASIAALDADEVRRCADNLLDSLDGPNSGQVGAILDLLCAASEETVEHPSAVPFFDAVLLALSTQDNLSKTVRGAFVVLVLSFLPAGPTASRYKEVVVLATELWGKVRSIEALTWALDLLDAFASNASPDLDARSQFARAVGTASGSFAMRIAPYQRTMLIELAAECGTEVHLPSQQVDSDEPDGSDPWSGLSKKSVGLYSLLDGVGGRFKSRLQSLNSTVKVETNSDTVATASLRTLAASADFMVVDTRHAAHAATMAIDEVRSRDRQLFPSGRGLSSFIERVRHELDTIEAS
jgi:hypothetical protein